MKNKIQFIIVIILISVSVFVVYKFFVSPQKDLEKLKEAASGSVNTIDVGQLIKRNFKTEQTDILEDERFQSLVDNSVASTDPTEIKAGKKNPFENN